MCTTNMVRVEIYSDYLKRASPSNQVRESAYMRTTKPNRVARSDEVICWLLQRDGYAKESQTANHCSEEQHQAQCIMNS